MRTYLGPLEDEHAKKSHRDGAYIREVVKGSAEMGLQLKDTGYVSIKDITHQADAQQNHKPVFAAGDSHIEDYRENQ
jgi:hypothetical protein